MPRAPGSKIIPWLLFGVVALIVYGSLYPFNFKPDAIRGGVFQALRELSWARAGRGDRISNVLLYLPVGFCVFLLFSARVRRVPALVFTTLIGAALSLGVEVAQVYISVRVPSLTDLSLNAFGTALGAIGGIAWRIGAVWMHVPQRVEKPRGDATASLLVALWLLWRFAPFVPHLDLGKLKAALRPLFAPQVDAMLVFAFLTCWIVVSQALAAIVSRARLLEALLALIAVVLVGRLLVAEQAFVPSELIALVLLLPVLVVTDRLTSGPRKALLLGSMLFVFIGFRLAPFNFVATAAPFDFWPFLAWFDAGLFATLRQTDWPMLFGQVFVFAAVLWVIKHCGASIDIAVGMMLALAFATEILQLWLPAHTASLTDVVLAIVVAMSFRYVERRARLTHRYERNP